MFKKSVSQTLSFQNKKKKKSTKVTENSLDLWISTEPPQSRSEVAAEVEQYLQVSTGWAVRSPQSGGREEVNEKEGGNLCCSSRPPSLSFSGQQAVFYLWRMIQRGSECLSGCL